MDAPHLITLNEFEAIPQKTKDRYLKKLIFQTDPESIKKVALLIKSGANVNKANSRGYTLLMAASYLNAISNVALLIQAGANIDDTTKDNDTALSIAISAFSFETASLLYNLMTEKQLKRELHLNELRYHIFEHYKPDIQPYFKDFKKKKRKRDKSIEVLLLRQHKTTNPFSILPKELKYLIVFMYYAVEKKMLLEPHCLAFQKLDIEVPLQESKMLIFSQPKKCIKQEPYEEDLVEKFSLLSTKEKKNKRKGCIIS